MKYLIMCEGPNEREIVNILLENNLLKFTEDDLLGLTTYHARQIASSGQVKTELNIYPGEVVVRHEGRIFLTHYQNSHSLNAVPMIHCAEIQSMLYCTNERRAQ